MREYEFGEQLRMSQGIQADKDIGAVLLANIPGATYVKKSESDDDRNGTDYWVYHARGEPYSIDVKFRSEDYAIKAAPFTADDLALETWSVIEKRVIGWTRDEKKMTDYVMWFWKDTGRWCLIPFAMLCAVFQEMWEPWRKEFKTRVQSTECTSSGRGWHSECVFVPRREVWAAIYKRYGGSTTSGLSA
jgi:hypothetical protein